MRNRVSAIPLLMFLSLFLVAGCDPTGPIPGGELSGQVVAHPGSWNKLNDIEVVQLEVAGSYSVNIWGVGLDQAYYVASAKGEEAKWSSKIAANAAVRLRIEDQLYELKAVQVKDPEESKAVVLAYKEKYELEANEDFPDSILYRLDKR